MYGEQAKTPIDFPKNQVTNYLIPSLSLHYDRENEWGRITRGSYFLLQELSLLRDSYSMLSKATHCY